MERFQYIRASAHRRGCPPPERARDSQPPARRRHRPASHRPDREHLRPRGRYHPDPRNAPHHPRRRPGYHRGREPPSARSSKARWYRKPPPCSCRPASRSARPRSATWARWGATWRTPPPAPIRSPRWSAWMRKLPSSPPAAGSPGRSTSSFCAPTGPSCPKAGCSFPSATRRQRKAAAASFYKLGRRNALAISRLTVAALGRLDEDGRIAEARIVPGSATPQILRFRAVEESLLGKPPTEALCQEASQAVVAEMTRITGRRWSSEFKEPALQAMTMRALLHIFGLPGARDGRPA